MRWKRRWRRQPPPGFLRRPDSTTDHGRNNVSPRRCWTCNSSTHYQGSCPHRATPPENQRPREAEHRAYRAEQRGVAHLSADIKGNSVQMLVDTGSSFTLIPPHLASKEEAVDSEE